MPALPFAAPENFSWAYLQRRRAFLRAWGPRGVSENERSTVSTAAPPNVSKNPDEQQVRFRVKSARGKQTSWAVKSSLLRKSKQAKRERVLS